MAKSKQGSRLSRTLEQQSKKQLYIFFLSSIAFITLLVFTGPKILDFIGTHMIGTGSEQQSTEENTIEFVTPPIFTTIPQASEKDTITISGTTTSKTAVVEIFVNNRREASVKVSETNSFEAKNIKLQEGQNVIKGRSIVGDRKSEYTKDYLVLYTKEPPKIEDVSPGDGTEFKRGDQEIRVQGKTEPQNTVTVNNFRAIVDENGNFSYYLRLNEGENKISIKAVNVAGKETTKDLTVRFSP
ncbi:MAG TPA: hypothetical protein PLD54_03090 [Candidatus Levybacteria bacterium]|nr:hypothetical protein [Candidatus Levybacteria bacterium]